MKNMKQQAGRKAAPPALSAEEELAELLADPTLQPSISFLGIRESPATPAPDTASVPGTGTVSDIESTSDTEAPRRSTKRILFNSPGAEMGLRGLQPTEPLASAESAPHTVSVGGIGIVPRFDSRPPVSSVPAPVSRSGLPKNTTPRYQRPKARRATTVEDGHSHIEQHVYETLWNAAEPQDPSGDSRVLTIGFGTMSHLVRLSLNNCRLNVRSLIRKLALDEHREELCPQGVGKTYLIYSPETILRRRHEAGLEWVIRTRGVAFVDPATELPLEKSS